MKEFKGLVKDTSYLKNPPGTWQEARNILLTKQYNSPVNENGTKFNHLIEGEICGVIETNQHIVYFSIVDYPDYDSLVSVYNHSTKIITQALKGKFHFNRPIEGIYKYNYKGNLIVAWSDGVFENSTSPKIVKITGIDLPLVGGVLSDNDKELINLFPNIHKGSVEASTDEGHVVGIQAYATFKYGRKHEETRFKDLNTSASLLLLETSSNTPKPAGLRLNFTDLDFEVYDYIIIGVHIVGTDDRKSYKSERIQITSSELVYNINSISALTTISDDELLVPSNLFTKMESLTLHEDTIMSLNVHTNPIFKFQKYANLLKIVPKQAEGEGKDFGEIKFEASERLLMPNEAYDIKIQLDLLNGDTTEWFNIPNLEYDDSEELDIFRAGNEAIWKTKYQLDLNNYDTTVAIPEYKFINKGNENRFGLWKDEQIFPEDDEYNSALDYDGTVMDMPNAVDLRGKNLTYHRIPEEAYENSMTEIKDSSAYIGAMITNFNQIPVSVRKQIKGVRLGFTKRTFGNSLVIAEGLAMPVAPQIVGTVTSDIADISQINSTPFYPDRDSFSLVPNGTCFDRFVFLNPELEDIKPKLNFNTFVVKRFIWADERLINGYNTNGDIVDTDVEAKLNQNKFFNNYFNYDYKLPNNLAQGSTYTDGGLYINVHDNKDSLNKTDGGMPFLPHTNASNQPSESLARTKNIRYKESSLINAGNMNSTAAAIVVLVDVKDKLYSLIDSNIVASNNTILLNDASELTGAGLEATRFKLGDVSYGIIHGSLSCVFDRADDSSTFRIPVRYYNKHIKTKILTSYQAGILKVEDDIRVSSWSLYTGNENDATALTTKIFGYTVGGNIANASLNDLSKYPTLDIFKEYLSEFPARVIRSNSAPNEAFIINALRTFLVEKYHELKNGKGDGVAIRSYSGAVYIQMRYSLLYAKVKDVLRTKDSDVFLQTRDIFDIEPYSLTAKPGGYIGSEHKFACKIIKEGYLTIDHQQGNVILVTPEVSILSMSGIRNWLREELEFDNTYREEVNGISKAIDNPFRYIGFSVGVDEAHNRIFITKLLPTSNNLGTIDREAYFSELVNDIPPDLETPILLDNYNSFTISFSLDFQSWVCYHTFVACMFIGFKRHLYALRNVPYGADVPNTGTIHAIGEGLKGFYFGNKEESYVDLIFNKDSKVSKSLYALELITESFIQRHNNLEDTDKTISKIVVFNSNQCSGTIELDVTNKDIIRYVEGTYRINNFRDLLKSPDLPILGERGEIIENNLNYNKNWFDKSYFLSKFIVIRLIWNNDVQDDVYLNELNLTSKISKR